MPIFQFHLRFRGAVEFDEVGLECRDLHHAYLEACKAIPDTARDLLIAGQGPMECGYAICDGKGINLMEVPFADILSPAEWRIRGAPRRPHDGPRSDRTRDDLALSSFRRMFSGLNVGCVLMTPELEVREMNAFGARHSHVDPEAIRGKSILDIFTGLRGAPKESFTKFMMLARSGAISEIVDLPYLVLDEQGETADGWWNARAWPIFDDDDHLLGIVEWAEPSTKPMAAGSTLIRIAQDQIG